MTNFKISDVYEWCMAAFDDGKYCSNLVDAVLQATHSRVFHRLHPRGKPSHMLLLLYAGDYDYDVLIDKSKRVVVVMLHAPNHSVALRYERRDDGKFILKTTTYSNIDFTAMLNGPLKLPK